MFLTIIYTFFIINFMGKCLVATTENDVNNNKIPNYYEVNTKNGRLRGIEEKTLFSEKKYYSFKGIPYAKPPVNELRYMPPEPIETWNNVKDAINFGNDCLQISMRIQMKIMGEEDCLYLNIYTPDISPSANLPVMVFIHGGGFFEGSGSDFAYGPDFLLNENVILVTLNYRLGVFGFLSLHDTPYTGNMGLKDQHLAIKWVKNNIKEFGGNPNHITLFGHSAGAASTQYQLLHKDSGKLFNRAIIMSGSALNIWAFDEYEPDEILLDHYIKNGFIKSKENLVDFLKETDGHKLLETTPLLKEPHNLLLFLPKLEKESDSAFLTEKPLKLLKNLFLRHHEILFGFASREALHFWDDMVKAAENLHDEDKFMITLPISGVDCPNEVFNSVKHDVREFYFKNNYDNKLDEMIQLSSDINFIYGVERSAKLHSTFDKNIFYYRFAIDGKLNGMKIIKNLTQEKGAAHADEICYIFKCLPLLEVYKYLKEDSLEYKAINNIVKRFTNFAKYGNPGHNEEWLPIKGNDINFLDMTNSEFKINKNPNQDRFKFWDKNIEKCQLADQQKIKNDEL